MGECICVFFCEDNNKPFHDTIHRSLSKDAIFFLALFPCPLSIPIRIEHEDQHANLGPFPISSVFRRCSKLKNVVNGARRSGQEAHGSSKFRLVSEDEQKIMKGLSRYKNLSLKSSKSA